MVAACGDDDDVASTDAFCELARTVDEQAGPPTVAQLNQYKDVRPDEIGAEVDLAADAIIAADGDIGAAFGDPDVAEAIDRIDAYEVDTCGIEDDGEGDDEDAASGDIDPAFAEYCAASADLDESDGPPTPEQFEELRTLAPDEIGEEVGLVVDALVASDFDFGTAFGDPEVGAAMDSIDAFETESCGKTDDGGEDDDVVTEPTPGATVVPVTAVDFAFEGVPAEVPAGPVSLAFQNKGDSAHEMAVFRIGEGFELDELLAQESEPTDEQATDVGGTFGAPGDPTSYVNGDLEAGTYALVCFIPGPEGKSHYELGMKTTFTVT